MHPRTPLFCDVALARRVERAEAALMRAAAGRHDGFVIPLAGGVATFAADGSPLNKVAGLGFDGPPAPVDLDRVERAFAERGSPVQVELAHLAGHGVAGLLSERGYRLASFENVLGRRTVAGPVPDPPPGVRVAPAGAGEVAAWLRAVVDAAAVPDTEGLPSHEDFPRAIVEEAERDLLAAGAVPYLARLDGAVAGGAAWRATAGVAQFTGAATVPAYRRRGVQAALLAARLADAAAAGCDVAVVTTQPASRSQRNVQRRGFDLLYTRAILVKHP
jgi:GNAT superfamily N-acetyltransferase